MPNEKGKFYANLVFCFGMVFAGKYFLENPQDH